MSFNFNTPKTASGFTLTGVNAATNTTTATIPGGSGDNKISTTGKLLPNLFGTSAPTTSSPASVSGFFLGSNVAKTVPSTSLTVGLTTTSTTSVTFGITNTVASNTPQFNLSTTTTGAAAAASSITTTNTATTAAVVPIPNTSSTSATSFTPIFTGASLSSTSAPVKLTTTSAVTTTSISAPTGGLGTSTAPILTTATTSVTAPSGSLTYTQLEDSIHKWTIDLEEQGKFFINQAKQLNAWDNLLISNSDKILQLNESIEQVKQQQKQLDQELDFVLAQQNELDALSLPLEKQLADIPVTDQNRLQMYQLSEIIDSQLKQMSEDVKEIVERLNESNKNEDISDPVIQVSRILNAHMNSLQWIDRNTSQICSHLEQISDLHETYKKNHLNL